MSPLGETQRDESETLTCTYREGMIKKMTQPKLRRRYGHMAYNRETFKDKVEEYISGAWLEFYKARLAAKNGQTKWIAHWMSEVRSLLGRLDFVVLQHPIRGFQNQRVAIDQVVTLLQKKDARVRRKAEHIVKADYNLKKVRALLTDTDRDDFWKLVEAAVISGLDDRGES